ncbi:MAG: histidine kinase dimerization/phospho-acceptor domain-containing protein [Bacteroidota bacterium]
MTKNVSLKIANEEFFFQNHEKDKLETELIIANEELKRAKDHQKEYINELEELMFITHKLRQPITQILGLSILLTDSCYTQNQLKRMIDMIGESARSLDNFTRELTTFTQRKKTKCQ